LRLAATLLVPAGLGVVGFCGSSLATTATARAAATTTTSGPITTTTLSVSTAPSEETTTTSLPAGTTLPTTTAALPGVWTEVGSPDVIDPGAATQLLESYWSLRQQYLVQGSANLLSLVESGPALQEDQDSCGCGVVPWGPMLAESLFLTRQTGFPAYFLAQAVARIPATSSQGGLITLVFQRAAATAPWTVIVDSQQQLVTTNDPSLDVSRANVDQDGFDIAVPVLVRGGSAVLPADLARYWESWAENGRAPKSTPLLPGFWTTEHGPGIWQQEHQLLAGYITRYRYHVANSNNAWEAPANVAGAGGPGLPGGFELSCGTSTETATFTSPVAGGVYQPPQRDVFPPALAPGYYSKVVVGKASSPCFMSYPGGKTAVIGAVPIEVSVTGYPLAAP
jgi:hypothetical protein